MFLSVRSGQWECAGDQHLQAFLGFSDAALGVSKNLDRSGRVSPADIISSTVFGFGNNKPEST
jgi:hypothetical protein